MKLLPSIMLSLLLLFTLLKAVEEKNKKQKLQSQWISWFSKKQDSCLLLLRKVNDKSMDYKHAIYYLSGLWVESSSSLPNTKP